MGMRAHKRECRLEGSVLPFAGDHAATVGNGAGHKERMSSLRKCVAIGTARHVQISAGAGIARECVALCTTVVDAGTREPIKNDELRKNA